MELKINEVSDGKIWDDFVTQNSPGSLFQSFKWGEVQQKLGLNLMRLGVFSGKELVGLAQIVTFVAKRGKFLHIRHGPILKPVKGTIYEKRLAFLFAYLINLAKKQKCLFLRISPQIENSAENNYLYKKLGFQSAPIQALDGELCWVLDLDKTEAELLAGMRKTTRYLIRQAEKTGVVVEQTENIRQFQRLYTQTYLRHAFVPYHGVEEEYQIFAKANQAVSLVATHHGQPLAAAIILFFANQAIYHHGASVPTKIPASYLLQWYAIREAKKRGKKLYNFWGIAPSDSPRHPWSGISLFKRGFGGRVVQFLHTQDLPLSPFYAISYTIELVRKIRKGY